MPNPLNTYILNIYDFSLLGSNAILTFVGYLMLNPLFTYILNINDLAWLGLMAYQTLLAI